MKKITSFLQSVRFRLTLWYVGLLALLLAVFSVVVYLILTGSLHSGLDDLLRARVSQLVGSYNISNGQLNLQERDETGQVVPAEGEILLLLNPQGVLIQKAGRLSQLDITALTRLANTTAASLHGQQEYFTNYELSPDTIPPGSKGSQIDYRVLLTAVTDNGLTIGTLVLGRSRESTEAISRNLFTVLLLIAPLTLLASAGGGYWLANRAMGPVRTITHTAREMGETDLSRRLNLKRTDELGELAATFDAMLNRLQNAFERQRQFTADASHELRTPLSIIHLEAEQALSGIYTKEKYRQVLADIKSESEHMARLINDLLLLARADASRSAFKHETLDLGEIALEVVERLKPLAGQQGISLGMSGGELPELLVEGDYLYLSQMLTNLVENAIKYTVTDGDAASISNSHNNTPFESFVGNQESKWVQVEVRRAAQKGWATIQVSDNGPGIAAWHLPYLFDRFYQVDKARTHLDQLKEVSGTLETTNGLAGSGLGLAIVKWVVEAHGGQVKVESRVAPQPSGTTFEVRLPTTPND